MAQSLIARFVSLFEGDPGVRMVAEDPVLSAELLLLFRMILADGAVSETEMQAFRRICAEAFGIPATSIDSVIEYLNEVGYETTGAQALAMFRELDEDRRRLLAKHLADIAKADSTLAANEVKLLRRTLEVLDLGGPRAV
jgi:uncharacterized tellurite resistance protein B-like protein